MKSFVRTFAVALGLVLFAAFGLQAQPPVPTVTLINQSGQPALVRLVGERSVEVDLPAGSSQTVRLSGGVYSVRMRYGAPGHYRYAKGGSFQVVETEYRVTRATITLHAAAGNMNEAPSSQGEFESR